MASRAPCMRSICPLAVVPLRISLRRPSWNPSSPLARKRIRTAAPISHSGRLKNGSPSTSTSCSGWAPAQSGGPRRTAQAAGARRRHPSYGHGRDRSSSPRPRPRRRARRAQPARPDRRRQPRHPRRLPEDPRRAPRGDVGPGRSRGGPVRPDGAAPRAAALHARLRLPGPGGTGPGARRPRGRRSLRHGLRRRAHAARLGRHRDRAAALGGRSRPADRDLHGLLRLLVGGDHRPASAPRASAS